MNWEIISRPKRRGGLGVRVAKLQNTSHGNIFLAKKTKGFKTQTSIISALKELEDSFCFKLGNGNTSF